MWKAPRAMPFIINSTDKIEHLLVPHTNVGTRVQPAYSLVKNRQKKKSEKASNVIMSYFLNCEEKQHMI